jgi:hypothetical protein
MKTEAPWQNDRGMDGRGRHRPLNDSHGNQGRTVNQSNPDTSTANDLARYLARSQLVTSGLTNFDDKPENFWAWKSTFYRAITGLGLSAGEELDLLNKWLGKESSEQARRLKAGTDCQG